MFANTVCVQSICAQPDPWRCLGSSAQPPSAPATVTATLDLVDLISGAPIADVQARLCRKLDVDCADPIASDLQSDENGTLTVLAPGGFNGYVQLSPADGMPGMYFFYPPLISDREITAIPVVTQANLRRFAGLAGAQVVANRSAIFLGAHNCLDQPAGGVRIGSADADDVTVPFYLVQRVPTVSATATDAEGRGGLINVRPGSITVSGQLSSGETFATVSLFTRENQVTYTSLAPWPE